jgi:hypothetical protein
MLDGHPSQGCQMVCLRTENTNVGMFKGLGMKYFGILCPLDIFWHFGLF